MSRIHVYIIVFFLRRQFILSGWLRIIFEPVSHQAHWPQNFHFMSYQGWFCGPTVLRVHSVNHVHFHMIWLDALSRTNHRLLRPHFSQEWSNALPHTISIRRPSCHHELSCVVTQHPTSEQIAALAAAPAHTTDSHCMHSRHTSKGNVATCW